MIVLAYEVNGEERRAVLDTPRCRCQDGIRPCGCDALAELVEQMAALKPEQEGDA